MHVLRMLQPLRYLPHSQWVYWYSHTIFILLRRLPVNRYWCWSSLQLCAEQTAMLWSIEPLNWPHNIHHTSCYSTVNEKNEGKQSSGSENSLLIIKERDDGAGRMTGTSAGFGKRNDGAVMRVMGAAARTVGARHGIDGEHTTSWCGQWYPS